MIFQPEFLFLYGGIAGGLKGDEEFGFGDTSDVRFDKVFDFFIVRRFQRTKTPNIERMLMTN